MNLDSHIETKTKLAAHVITPHSTDTGVDIVVSDALDQWLVSATRDVVGELEAGEEQAPDGGWNVEYWAVEVAHPMGKIFGKLRYVLTFGGRTY